MASGAGMDISYIGHNTIYTPHHPIHLENILYVPRIKKNLVFIHHLTSNNSILVEFHPRFFFIKDLRTRNILLRGWSVCGLYSLPIDEIKQVCHAARSSINTWHNRLGHASSRVVKQVVSSNNISCSKESIGQYVCDACQQAKSHQLPYSSSTNVSKFPLEPIYLDVWDSAPESISRKKYYVSCIDDFSKFTWIYLLKFKSKVFQKFQEFHALVEQQFNRKILSIQSD
jgi:hypothetical protein